MKRVQMSSPMTTGTWLRAIAPIARPPAANMTPPTLAPSTSCVTSPASSPSRRPRVERIAPGRSLESTGLSRSEAIRSSLLASADRMRRRKQLAAEVAALEADADDRSEMLEVASLMESLRAAG